MQTMTEQSIHEGDRIRCTLRTRGEDVDGFDLGSEGEVFSAGMMLLKVQFDNGHFEKRLPLKFVQKLS